MNVDLSIDLCGVKMKNPTMLASGILGGTAGTLKRMSESGAGALVTKSIGPEPRNGYPGPTIIEPMENVLLNAMGLPNPGYKEFIKELQDIGDLQVPIIPSIFGSSQAEFAIVAKAMEDAGSKLIEVNVSCPHRAERNGEIQLIGQDPIDTGRVIKAIKDRVNIPVMVKLSPNVTNIGEIAVDAVKNGADAISAINTIEALEIEPTLERPVLGNLLGGQSGAAIRPIALRKITNIVIALEDAEKKGEIEKIVPVVGVGGICSAEDIIRFLLVGADCVQIGTALKKDRFLFKKCVDDLRIHMEEKGYTKLSDIKGNALKWLRH